jgi:diguanylate cyclase (GGDEF)-like protein
MNRKNKINSLIISIIILIGITSISFFSFTTYSNIIRDDILNISKLTSTNIYSEINNELTKPIFVALTMANDSFVKEWLQEENGRSESEIIDYLEGIRNKYNYHSVFLISSQSRKYFHYNGLFKTIAPEDAHDVWYYDFTSQDHLYLLDVDQDEVDHQLLTIFVNCKILDNDNNLIGVTGVGIEMSYIQELLDNFEKNYQLEAFLVDEKGLVQAHTNASFIEERNIRTEPLYQKIGDELYEKNKTINVFEIEDPSGEQYIISHYIEGLNWYLIVRKDTSILAKSFNDQLMYDLLIVTAVLASVLLIVNKILKKHDLQLNKMALIDTFGIMINRKGFDQKLEEILAKGDPGACPWSVFLMDLDHFKEVNDNHGHIQGDKILKHVMTLCNHSLAEHLITRWGGDEFSGIIYADGKKAAEILEELRAQIVSDGMLSKFEITVSIGIAAAAANDTEDSVIKRADQALYEAKSQGRNRVILK